MTAGAAMRGERRVHPSMMLHILGLTFGMAGSGMLVSTAVEAAHRGPHVVTLGLNGLFFAGVGGLLWRFTGVPDRIEILEVFTSVMMAWLGLAVAGTLPYFTTGTLSQLDNALFESISGFTTTGATVLRPIESASAGMLFFRALSQWIGGMGVIVLVVAVLPTVGSGGMDLLQAEAPGPSGERLTPRVQHTARNLWVVYVGLTAVCGVAYVIAGMSAYDGVTHAFTTLSTGGFSPHSLSMAHFESAAIEWIAITFMFIAGGSFAIWFRVLRGSMTPLLRSAELRLYAMIVLIATGVMFTVADTGDGIHDGIRNALFTVLTIITTTGYATADFGSWSQAAQVLILLMMPLGAMAGSTAGGVKLIRVLAVASYAHRATLRQLHPRMIRPIRIGKAVLDDDTTDRVLGYLVLALATFGAGTLLIALTGADIVTAASASATSFGNVGPGLGDIGPTTDFLNVPRVGRFVAMGAMLLGRLEIYPVLLALVALPRPRRPHRNRPTGSILAERRP